MPTLRRFGRFPPSDATMPFSVAGRRASVCPPASLTPKRRPCHACSIVDTYLRTERRPAETWDFVGSFFRYSFSSLMIGGSYKCLGKLSNARNDQGHVFCDECGHIRAERLKWLGRTYVRTDVAAKNALQALKERADAHEQDHSTERKYVFSFRSRSTTPTV